MTFSANETAGRSAAIPVAVVLGATALLCAALVLWAFAGPISGMRPTGDGADPSTYGFDLTHARFDGGALSTTGQPRDFLTALDDPEIAGGDEIALATGRRRGKEIVSTDRVVGIVIGDEARAYPLPLLNAHEIVNDTLGGVPIAVTFSPLADAPVVVDRRIRSDDGERVARFRVSGLVLDSTLLVYDAEEPVAAPSLWSPLRGIAVTGPAAAAGQTLARIDGVQLVAWRDWLATHPATTLALRDPAQSGRYRKIDYRRYLDGARPLLPVGREVPVDGPGSMTRMVVAERDGAVLIRSIDALVATGGRVDLPLGDASLSFVPDAATRTVRVEAPPGTRLLHGLWFALHAADPTLTEHLPPVDGATEATR